jgi:hypothetical protein
MNETLKGLALTALLVTLAPWPANAQTGAGALEIHGGWMMPAHHARGPQTTLGFDETPAIGGTLNLWFGQDRRWGILGQGTWSGWHEWTTAFGGDFGFPVTMWMYDGSLAFRLFRPTYEQRLLPYLSLGVGGVMVNPSNNPSSRFPTDPGLCANGGGSTCDFLPADAHFDQGRRTNIAAVAALGTEWFMARDAALRLEVKDYWTKNSPFRRLSDGSRHRGGHNLLLNAGLAFYIGRQPVAEPGFVREEPIVVTPPPAAAPPPPPPAEEAALMCVVDPNSLQVRMIEAVRIPSENRVYVTQAGQRIAFETAYPAIAPVYARNATWYMADQPLIVNLETDPRVDAADRNRIELVLFGSPAQRSAADLVFVGTITGTPVYANRTDVAPFQSRLETQFTTTTDLGTILRGDTELAREFGDLSTYYVAVEPNCVFRPVSVTHVVRRTRG